MLLAKSALQLFVSVVTWLRFEIPETELVDQLSNIRFEVCVVWKIAAPSENNCFDKGMEIGESNEQEAMHAIISGIKIIGFCGAWCDEK